VNLTFQVIKVFSPKESVLKLAILENTQVFFKPIKGIQPKKNLRLAILENTQVFFQTDKKYSTEKKVFSN